MGRTTSAGQLVWVEHFGRHFAVVLRVVEQRFIVAAVATSRDKPLPRVAIAFGTPESRAMHLELDTYFYRSNIAPFERWQPRAGTAPLSVRRALELFYGARVESVATSAKSHGGP